MIIRAVASIANFGVLLFLFIYIYALVGVQFFGNTMRFDDEGYPTPFTLEGFWAGTVPRNNFDTLLWAAVTVFQIITGENWNNIMYFAILGNGMLSVHLLHLTGDFVLMNLFLALLLDNFGGDGDEEQAMEKQEETKRLAQKMSVMSMKVVPVTSENERTTTTRGSFLLVSTAFSLGVRRQSILEMDEEGDEEDVRVVNMEKFADELTPSVPLAKTVYIEPPGRLTLPSASTNPDAAMLTFFEISTTEGWADVMMAAIDSNGIGMQPIRDNNMMWALFFVLFIMVGSFFVVNLFVGVIIDNFNRMKAALGGDFMLTPEQKKWIEAQKAASRVGPVRILRPPREKFRRILFYLVKMQRFEWFIMICIIVNTFLMAAQYFGQSTLQAYAINIINEIFAVIFTVEALFKLTAFGWEYFEDQWNQFDFFVVLGTLLSVVVELFTGASVRSLAMLVRVFRVTRILRLVKASKSIRQILLTLYIALPGLSNITSILFLMLFIYSTMGVQIFAKVALSDNIDSHANFQDFGNGFLFLLRAATGEAWNSCMHDLASSTAGCVDDPPYDPNMCGFNTFDGCVPLNGCGNPIAYAFFCTFTLLVTYVMLNLTIAVILEGFSLSHEDEEPLFEPEILDEFQTKWAEIDPKATGFVKVDKMLLLVNLLRPPLGKHGVPFDMAHFFKYMCQLKVPLYEDEYVHFRDVLLAMTREMVKLNAGTISDMPADQDTNAGVPGAKRRIEFLAHQYFGARRIQRQVAQWLRIKRQLEKKYMEEYKNKIKKPSGRPRKQRDARVFTIG
ncbi:hypothetical protein PRIC2_009876 [Phytophthora ramorum]